MAERTPFRYLDYRVYCHATEDRERISSALANMFGEFKNDEEKLSGFYGNPIIVLSGHLGQRKKILDFLERVRTVLSKEFLDVLADRIDPDQIFHIRLDKQAACHGEFELAGDQPENDIIDISIKIETFPSSYEKASAIIQGFFNNDSLEGEFHYRYS